MNKPKSILAIAVFITLCFFFTGCVGPVQHSKMDLTTDVRSQILNLKRDGSSDIDIAVKDEKLIKSGFLNTSGEEYGYYNVNYEENRHGRVGQMNLGFGWIMFHSLTCFITSLLGTPLDEAAFEPKVILRIYDSNGNQIKEYAKTGSFTKYGGLYYGDPTSKAEEEFKKLFKDVFQNASMESAQINNALLAAGPVSQEKDSEARNIIAASLAPISTQASNQYYSSEQESTYEPTYEQQQQAYYQQVQQGLAVSQQLMAQSQMHMKQSQALMNKGTSQHGQAAKPYQQPTTSGGSYSSQPSTQVKKEPAICGDYSSFKNMDRAYDGYVSKLQDMKTWPKKYNDSDRRNYQSSMRSVREKWNAHGCGNKIYKSSMEDWNGK